MIGRKEGLGPAGLAFFAPCPGSPGFYRRREDLKSRAPARRSIFYAKLKFLRAVRAPPSPRAASVAGKPFRKPIAGLFDEPSLEAQLARPLKAARPWNPGVEAATLQRPLIGAALPLVYSGS
jgi:hypothetical protein